MPVLQGDVTLPAVGAVPKKALVGIGGVAAAYVLWRYYRASQDYAGEDTEETGEFGDEEVLPAVAGAYSSDNSYGYGDTEKTTSDYGFSGTTNSQWTQYAVEHLVQSESWSYEAIVTALGRYLGSKALSSTEQAIVQSAIAVAGYPPEGTHPIIPGGDTDITIAPTGLKATTVTSTSVDLSWTAVSGATGYRVYRSGASENVGASNDTAAHIGGLEPGKKYTFYVAAMGAGSKAGPKSSGVAVTTKTVSLKAPTGLKATSVKATSVTLAWNKAENAEFYRIYVNGVARGTSEDTTHTVGALKKSTKYTIEVRSDSTGGSKSSPAKITVTTKKK